MKLTFVRQDITETWKKKGTQEKQKRMGDINVVD